MNLTHIHKLSVLLLAVAALQAGLAQEIEGVGQARPAQVAPEAVPSPARV